MMKSPLQEKKEKPRREEDAQTPPLYNTCGLPLAPCRENFRREEKGKTKRVGELLLNVERNRERRTKKNQTSAITSGHQQVCPAATRHTFNSFN